MKIFSRVTLVLALSLTSFAGQKNSERPVVSKEAGDRGGNGSQSITIEGKALLRDIVQKNNCLWFGSDMIKKHYPKVVDILEGIEPYHWLLNHRFKDEMKRLKFCKTERTLPPLSYVSTDDLYIFTNREFDQPAINDGGIIFMDMKLIRKMPPLHQAFTILHEIAHEFFDKSEPRRDRETRLREFIMNLHELHLNPADTKTYELVIEQAKMPYINAKIGWADQVRFYEFLDESKSWEERLLMKYAYEKDGIYPYNPEYKSYYSCGYFKKGGEYDSRCEWVKGHFHYSRAFKEAWKSLEKQRDAYIRQVQDSLDFTELMRLKEKGLIVGDQFRTASRTMVRNIHQKNPTTNLSQRLEFVHSYFSRGFMVQEDRNNWVKNTFDDLKLETPVFQNLLSYLEKDYVTPEEIFNSFYESLAKAQGEFLPKELKAAKSIVEAHLLPEAGQDLIGYYDQTMYRFGYFGKDPRLKSGFRKFYNLAYPQKIMTAHHRYLCNRSNLRTDDFKWAPGLLHKTCPASTTYGGYSLLEVHKRASYLSDLIGELQGRPERLVEFIHSQLEFKLETRHWDDKKEKYVYKYSIVADKDSESRGSKILRSLFSFLTKEEHKNLIEEQTQKLKDFEIDLKNDTSSDAKKKRTAFRKFKNPHLRRLKKVPGPKPGHTASQKGVRPSTDMQSTKEEQ